MSDEPLEEDRIVRTALRFLPIPEHEPDFWSRLSESLDAADPLSEGDVAPRRRVAPLKATPVDEEPTPDADDVVVIDLADRQNLGVVPPALRRGSNLILSAIAVAAAIAVVVAGATLVRDRSGSAEDQQAATTDAAGQAESSLKAADDDPSAGAAAMAAPEARTVTDADRNAATSAVTAWLAALGAGDTETAWASLGPASRDHWGSQAAFDDERSALAEGYGAWAAAEPDQVLVSPAGESPDGRWVVVTMVGTVAQEGTEEQRSDAFPVRIGADGPELEPWADVGPVEIVAPAADGSGDRRQSMGVGDDLVVVVPTNASAPILVVDAAPGIVCGASDESRLANLDAADGQRCSVRTSDGMGRGQHVLTVITTSPDGARISALAVLFELS